MGDGSREMNIIHAAYKAVKSFFYLSGIGRCDEQNTLNLKLVLFFKLQSSITDFFGEKKRVHTTFCLLVISAEVQIVIFFFHLKFLRGEFKK